jgi:hypothetical protein
MPVLIGATPEDKKELVGFQTGVRESVQRWRELLIDGPWSAARSGFSPPRRRQPGRAPWAPDFDWPNSGLDGALRSANRVARFAVPSLWRSTLPTSRNRD